MRCLAPGVYVDDTTNELHLDLVEMCVAAGFEPNDANQAALAEAASIVFAGTEIEVRGPQS